MIFFHHPDHRSQPFDIKGLEGEVIQLATEWKGREISANYPYLVKFDKKFRAHLSEHELEVL